VFPPTLTGTITGACCDRLNQSFEMSLSSSSPRVVYEATIGADVCNPIIVKQRVTLRCTENQWVVNGPCVTLDQPATLLSCNPLHIRATINLQSGGNPSYCCPGVAQIDFTE
jgi:hypothetical protein